MDWTGGYTSKWRLYSVNKSTWGEEDEISGLVSASVTKDIESTLIEDADITIDGEPINGYVRLILEAHNGYESARVPIGTFLVTSPKRSIVVRNVTIDLECYSVLKPASKAALPIGWYFPEGGDPIAGACELLSKYSQCPVAHTDSDLKTDKPKIAEDNETALSMAMYLLKDTDYYIKIDGNGRVSVVKKSEDVVFTFDTYDNDILFEDLKDETDVFDIPNIVRFRNGDESEIIKNEEDDSPISLQNLGWENWADESVSIEEKETFISSAYKRMEKISNSTRTLSYSREFVPDIYVNDVCKFMLPEQGIMGNFRIKSHTISSGDGAKVTELATVEVKNWRR